MKNIKLFCCLLVLFYTVNTSQGCTCAPGHPQQQFCRADFVIRATPISVTTVKPKVNSASILPVPGFGQKIYKVKVLETFKGHCTKGQIIKLYTAANSAACGAYLDTKTKPDYLIAGHVDKNGRRQINLCGWINLWSRVSSCIKARLCKKYYRYDFYHTSSGLYKDNCACQLTYCSGTKCEEPKKGCIIKSLNKQKNDICSRNLYSNKRGCSWNRCYGSILPIHKPLPEPFPKPLPIHKILY